LDEPIVTKTHELLEDEEFYLIELVEKLVDKAVMNVMIPKIIQKPKEKFNEDGGQKPESGGESRNKRKQKKKPKQAKLIESTDTTTTTSEHKPK
jgi:hypothetical protein